MTDYSFCHNCFAPITEERCPICGYSYKNDTDEDGLALTPGTMLNGVYKVGRVLGSGGFGITYKALDVQTNTVVAVKEYVPMNIVYRDMGSNNLEVKLKKSRDDFDQGLMAFIEEANYLVLLKNFSSIVRVFSCFNENNTAYFSMEYLDGKTLDKVEKMDFGLAYDAMLKTLEALRHVHNRGIIHRDISPQNITLMKGNLIKLIDFGNARFIGRNSSGEKRLILKPGFSPPELYMKENVQGPWTDIYSVAATFYRLTTKTKLPNALERINGVSIVPIRQFFPNISYGIEYALNRALELDYDKRPKDVEEFIRDLDSKKYQNTNYTEPFRPAEQPRFQQPVNNPLPRPDRDSQKQQGRGGFNVFQRRSTGGGPSVVDSILPKPAPMDVPANGANRQGYAGHVPLNAYVIGYDGRRYPLSDVRGLVLGREPRTSHIVVNNSAVSRRHCIIECNVVRREFYVTDWSSNGTFRADGTRFGYGTKNILRDGDVFYVCGPELSFKVVME